MARAQGPPFKFKCSIHVSNRLSTTKQLSIWSIANSVHKSTVVLVRGKMLSNSMYDNLFTHMNTTLEFERRALIETHCEVFRGSGNAERSCRFVS